MALARIQRTDGHGAFLSNLSTSAFGSANTAGNTIIVLVNTAAIEPDISSITDTAGNVYSLVPYAAISSFNDSNTIEIWTAQNIKTQANNVITVHESSSLLKNIIAIEVRGLAVAGNIKDPYDVGAGVVYTNGLSDGRIDADTGFSTTNPNDFILMVASLSANVGSWSLGVGYSNLENPTTSGTAFAAESKVVSTTALHTGTIFTTVNNQNAIATCIAFSDTALGGVVSPSSSASASRSPSASTSASRSPSASVSPSSSASASRSPSASTSPSGSVSPSSSTSPSSSSSHSLSPSASLSPSSSLSFSPSASVSPSSSRSPSSSLSPSSSASLSLSPSASRSPSTSLSPSSSVSSSASPSASLSSSPSASVSPSSSHSPSPSASSGADPITVTLDEPPITAEVDTDSSPVSIES